MTETNFKIDTMVRIDKGWRFKIKPAHMSASLPSHIRESTPVTHGATRWKVFLNEIDLESARGHRLFPVPVSCLCLNRFSFTGVGELEVVGGGD